MRASDFEWSDLRFFLAVARAGRLTVAASRLKVEHSTVSRRIGALEAALGAKLFDRLPAGYALTAAGERLLASAEAMESIALGAQGQIAGSDRGVSGTVRIGAPDGFGSYFLAPRIGALAARHPDLEIQLLPMPRVFSLSKREVDIAITVSRPKEGRVHARKLADYSLRLYASRAYLDRHGPIESRAALASHDFIGYVDDLIYDPKLNYVPLVAKDIRVRLKSSGVAAQLMATRAGAGVCVLHSFIADLYGGDGPDDLVPVLHEEVGLTRTFWLLTHPDTRELARIRVAADFIVEAAQRARGALMAG
ncbi:LysR family transcriptional regulator [Xanthobacter tagetidis]|jgi:DNA-binding transcriptional LysR family regulator|uniref:LysR family transcriptional regulator n=1 Tax=Xanthobacter tagetidis TaxID=60216 RepID=UPI0017A510DA|nr:LysR family transcriptional regulator [Xanthobacter tagetidis]MBB6306532.1 DNA-binding transcriptional LysR family regulator [Xanthobacter tagetidis]